ncbi:uncharacterized protein bub1 isoform X2 [Brachyhypopomus gauderio]|uniref:uncharacterized protein bub1 isoform X2 n=1 Tax=Brachyhypopomus gauderio TaxID=698409 RepID=UPI0040417765
MDINFYLQSFESSVRNYAGNDPLDPWDKFVEFLELRLPSEEKCGISVVLDRLVQTFLQDKRYHNDTRFVNHCIKCASFHSEAGQVFSSMYSEGVGTHCAMFYVSWAQHLEQKGLLAQALQVYQRAVENQAEPLDTVQQYCRLFQSKTEKSQTVASDARNPLQNSQIVNQNPQQREPVQLQCKELENLPTDRTVRIVSRSENNPKPSSGSVEYVSMYCVKEVQGDGYELCFEELRARRYFSQRKHQEELKHQEEALKKYEEEKEEIKRLTRQLEELDSKLNTESDQISQPTHHPQAFHSVSCNVQKPVEPSNTWSLSERPAPCSAPGPLSVSLSQRPASPAHVGGSEQNQATAPERPLLSLRKSESHLLRERSLFPADRCSLTAVQPSFQRPPHTDPDTHPADATQPPSWRAEGTSVGADASLCMRPTGQFDPLPGTRTAPLPPDRLTRAAWHLADVCSSRAERSLLDATVQQGAALPRDAFAGAEGDATTDNVIMDMFQAPTLLQDTFFNITSQAPDASFEKSCCSTGSAPSVKPPSLAPFRIYQDESDGDRGVDVVKAKPMAPRPLMEIPVSKGLSVGVESLSDDSAIWGPRYSSVATCPSITRDFTLDTHLVSTPLHPTAPYTSLDLLENVPRDFSGAEENPFLRQPTKLSPILEQSPSEEKPSEGAECTMRGQGTIVGEGVCLPQQSHTFSLSQHNQTSCSISRNPLAPLAFPDPMVAPAPTAVFTPTVAVTGTNAKASWAVYQSPEKASHMDGDGQISARGLRLSVRELQPDQVGSNQLQLVRQLKPDQLDSNPLQSLQQGLCSSQEDADVLLPKTSFHSRKSQIQRSENRDFSQDSCMVLASPKWELRKTQDVPMSPDPAPRFEWLLEQGPANITEPGLDVTDRSSQISRTVPGSLLMGSKPSWSIYQSPGYLPDHHHHLPFPTHEPMEESDHHTLPDLQQSGILLSKRSFNRRKSDKRVWELGSTTRTSLLTSPKPASTLDQDSPMSPEPAPGLSWFCTDSPPRVSEPDLDVLMTPQHSPQHSPAAMNVPGPSAAQLHCATDVPLSPTQPSTPAAAPSRLVPDPWDEDLIASLLSGLPTPLSSYPGLSTWSRSLPTITPKMTMQLAGENLQVDFVLGRGAFATVYQATNLSTSQKLILKVQKPANPWEFYINGELNTRVQPRARHLFNKIHCAHLFTNGSVLIGELHNCGTLLNVVNLYKCRSEKVMPQPLVLYFTVCILRMMEELHQTRIIHADIKPDNFMLGERFLENESFDVENLDHGLVLIDFGQSIDMSLFPKGTAFTARCMTSGFQCTEMLSARPWNYQTDYFGIAGTVHCMIFGSYMQVRNENGVWRSNGIFKRNPHSELWQEFFHTLLNIPGCETLPCLRSLRVRLSAALQENYSTKLCSLKKRLVVQILEARSSRR